jgi:hypothetical protein
VFPYHPSTKTANAEVNGRTLAATDRSSATIRKFAIINAVVEEIAVRPARMRRGVGAPRYPPRSRRRVSRGRFQPRASCCRPAHPPPVRGAATRRWMLGSGVFKSYRSWRTDEYPPELPRPTRKLHRQHGWARSRTGHGIYGPATRWLLTILSPIERTAVKRCQTRRVPTP